jgi:hypothetical protein
MSVNELNQEQIDTLKSNYFVEVENNYDYPEEIPNEVILNYYSDIDFVNDDFFCSMGQ